MTGEANPVGRPTKMTDLVIAKLEAAFLLGCTDQEACLSAGIVPSTLYRYAEANPHFSERKETLKNNPFLIARKVIIDSLATGNLASAHKVIDRKEGGRLSLAGSLSVEQVSYVIEVPATLSEEAWQERFSPGKADVTG